MLFVHARCDLATAAAVIGRWSCFGYIFFTQANTEPLFRPALNNLLSSPTDHNALSAILGTQLPRPSEIAPKTNSTPTCLQANAIGNHDRLQRQAEGIVSTSATGDEDIIHKCVESFGRSFLLLLRNKEGAHATRMAASKYPVGVFRQAHRRAFACPTCSR